MKSQIPDGAKLYRVRHLDSSFPLPPVYAFQIAEIEKLETGEAWLHCREAPDGIAVKATREYMDDYKPVPGDYWTSPEQAGYIGLLRATVFEQLYCL